mgnify:CR=1 FL=1
MGALDLTQALQPVAEAAAFARTSPLRAIDTEDIVAATLRFGKGAIGTFAPPLDAAGNSVRGQRAIADISTALGGSGERGRIYFVETLCPFEDDPNVTDKRFPGNPTQSYRTRSPLRVVGEVDDWDGHDPAVLAEMLAGLARLREQGLDAIED